MTLAVYPSCLEGPPPISRFTSPCLFGKPPSVENKPTTRHPCLKIEENLDGIESHPPSHDTSTPISPIEPGRLDPKISHFPQGKKLGATQLPDQIRQKTQQPARRFTGYPIYT